MVEHSCPVHSRAAAPAGGHASAMRHFVVLALVMVLLMAKQAGAQGATQQVRLQSTASDRAVLTARLHRPNTRGPVPAVVLMHGCGGWQPEVLASLEAYARFISSNGFVVLNLDSFSTRNRAGGRVCGSLGELSRARDYRTHDAFAALQFLRNQSFVDAENVFLVGQSNGGSVALISALSRTASRFGGEGFRGVVALYPWCGAAGGTRLDLHSPVLVLGGGRDDWVPPDQCSRFRGRGQELSVTIYPHAAHSFDLRIPIQRYMGNLVGYNPQAAAATRTEMLAFFRRHIADGRTAMR
ncbi:Dienelactone hydrolase [Salinihabitans flavidus]|uniref:Dienelactone hydrolase n=1 Tax=Salinihabitans flavidus TaxID=569882 RepID=A0A1H8UBI2_9RHOB|nr:dienelactone hydrolase family protein [Salinihabitans flavidus]SEP00223.1 Dienelactone hydrolase [Salinihabitans flavidus]